MNLFKICWTSLPSLLFVRRSDYWIWLSNNLLDIKTNSRRNFDKLSTKSRQTLEQISKIWFKWLEIIGPITFGATFVVIQIIPVISSKNQWKNEFGHKNYLIFNKRSDYSQLNLLLKWINNHAIQYTTRAHQ